MSTVVVSQVTLLLSALFLAGRSYQVSEKHNSAAIMVISLAAAFITCSSAADLLITQTGQDSETLKRILANLAFYASIPLIASAALDQAYNFNWSKAAWGRWLLVLFALFELCRRSNTGMEYSQFMVSISSAVLIFSMIKLRTSGGGILGLLGSTLYAVSLITFSPASLMPAYQSISNYYFLFSAALILLALATKRMISSSSGN